MAVRPIDLPVLDATSWYGTGGRGASQPVVLRAADGRLVHVKLQHNPLTTRSLVGDLIGTCLGRLAGAPFPEPVLLRLTLDQRAAMPALARYRWYPGVQFATVYEPGARRLDPERDLDALDNLDELPLAALTEAWLYNVDLKPDHVLLVPREQGGRMLFADHGYILPHGPRWTIDGLRRNRYTAPSLEICDRIARAARRPFDFRPAMTALASIGRADVERVVARVPPDWSLPRREALEVVDFLAGRTALLPRLARHLEEQWYGRSGGTWD